LAGIGNLVDLDLSFALISSYLFYPLAWLMGVAPQDCLLIASLLGYKIFANEFVAYVKLAEMVEEGLLEPKSVVIATYALCGFSNLASIGAQLGALTPMAPGKAKSLSKLALSAMIAGNTACRLTGATAGLMYDANVDSSSIV
jgi:CNT family concentrative nucleoside transporter